MEQGIGQYYAEPPQSACCQTTSVHLVENRPIQRCLIYYYNIITITIINIIIIVMTIIIIIIIAIVMAKLVAIKLWK
jgi:hypothetical protein